MKIPISGWGENELGFLFFLDLNLKNDQYKHTALK